MANLPSLRNLIEIGSDTRSARRAPRRRSARSTRRSHTAALMELFRGGTEASGPSRRADTGERPDAPA
jgi:hypothetical protein